MLIIADLHLGKISDSIIVNKTYSQISDVEKVLDAVLVRAIQGKHTIVVAGDVFNVTNPPTWIIAVWFGFLAKCKVKHIKVVQIPGNHDAGVDWVNLSMVEKADLDNVVVVKGVIQLEIDNKLVTFLPHLPLRVQEDVISEFGSIGNFVTSLYPDADFIIGHGQIRGITYSNDIFFEAGDALDINFEDFPNCKLMVLGHVHKHMEYKSDHGVVVYPGSMTITNFGEVDDVKGYITVNADLTTTFHAFDVPVTSYLLVQIDLLTKSDVNLDEDMLADLVTGAIIKIVVTTNDLMKVNEAKIRKAFNKWGYVSRFETIKENALVTEINKKIFTELTPIELLNIYVADVDISKKIRDLAIKKGKWIIQEVTNAL